MKKLILVFTLIAVASVAMYSCNNGAYDARPDSDLSAGLNPFEADSGEVSVYLGTMQATINHKKLIFSPAFYYTDEDGVTNKIIARVKDDSIFHRTLRITFPAYDGPKEYKVEPNTGNPIVNFVQLDTSRVDKAGRDIFNTYTANTNDGVGYGLVNITGDEGGHYRGFMYARMHRTMPDKNYADTIKMDYSEFYFEKVPFPVPEQYTKYLFN